MKLEDNNKLINTFKENIPLIDHEILKNLYFYIINITNEKLLTDKEGNFI